jgi:two-component system response regulator MprA
MTHEQSLPGLRVLLVEDDKELAASVRAYLEEEGCEVHVCFDGGAGLRQAQMHAFDILLLDIRLPVLDGFEVTKRLRMQGFQFPIVLLSGLDTAGDVVHGLNAGADDYLTKPFDLEVLVARMQARIRSASRENVGRLSFADLTLDIEKREATRGGKKLDLTRTEFAILECLMRSAGRVARRDHLIEFVWTDRDVSENNLETYIRYLRQKVDQPGMPRLIRTVRGFGYSLRNSAI